MTVVSSEATTAVALFINVISPANGEGLASASSPNAIITVVLDPQHVLGKRASTAESISAGGKSQDVCWLLRANHEHPNLQPIDEHDWASLLETAKEELRRE